MAVRIEHREPSYCTPEMVADTMGLADPNSPMGRLSFSDASDPPYDFVEELIVSNEDIIDGQLRQSWRVNRVVDHICSIHTYEQDRNGVRSNYFQKGGDFIQLHKHMLPFDPTQGDRLLVRIRGDQWADFTDSSRPESINEPYEPTNVDFPGFWCDLEQGKVYLRTRLFQTKDNAVKITYRWGSEEPVPAGIARLCSLRVARDIFARDIYYAKVGVGGDVAGLKQQNIQYCDARIGELYGIYQRSGSVHSLLQ